MKRYCLCLVVSLTAALQPPSATASEISQQAYLKGAGDERFGESVAVSGDTMIVGAPYESNSGAAYIFVRSGTNWIQQAILKATNAGANDAFGYAVAVSGGTVLVGAPYEDSNATGVNGNATNNSALDSGAAYVFVRNGTNWTQQAYLKASNTGMEDYFGLCVGLSGDTVVVGAAYEDSSATGVNGNQSNNNASTSGAAYVFVRSGTNWNQQAYLKASNTGTEDYFGAKLAVSGDTVVVGALGEDSNATGVNGNQISNSAVDSGAAYVFVRTGANWVQKAYLKASNTGADDYFGYSLAVSDDTVVVGALQESSNATGVNGNQNDNSSHYSGAAYVFVRTGTNWAQQAYLKASNTEPSSTFPGDQFGATVAVSGDTVAVVAPYEASGGTGINGNQNDNGTPNAGAVYVFVRQGSNWSQQAYLKASTTGSYFFGGLIENVGVHVSGNTIVVGAPSERPTGAAYVFTGLGPTPPELRLALTRIEDMLHLTVTGTTNTQWRLESRETVTGTDAWQLLTNITLGADPTVIQQPLTSSNRFYRGAWVP